MSRSLCGDEAALPATDLELLRICSEFTGTGLAALIDVGRRHDVNPNCRTKHGVTPLHLLASRPASGRDVDVNQLPEAVAVETVISLGGDPNAQDSTGQTPLHIAIVTPSFPAASALLRLGADICLRDQCGDTPRDKLQLALTYRSSVSSTARAQLDLLEKLFKHHVVLSLQDLAADVVRGALGRHWLAPAEVAKLPLPPSVRSYLIHRRQDPEEKSSCNVKEVKPANQQHLLLSSEQKPETKTRKKRKKRASFCIVL